MLPPNGGSVQRPSVPGSTGTTSWCASRRIGASVVSLPAQRYSRLSPPTRSRVNAACSRGKVRWRYSCKSRNGVVSTPLAPPKEIVRNRRARASRSAAAAVSSAIAGAGSAGICRVRYVVALASSTTASAAAAPPSANSVFFTMPLVSGGPLRWRLGGNAANSLFAGDGGDGAAPDDHLERGADVRTRLGGVPLRIHGAERPGGAREGERDRPPQVGVQDLSGRRAHEQRRAGEAEQQAGHDPPAEIARAPRDDRVEEGHPQGDRHDENARDPRRGELLGPHDERVAPGEEEQSDDRGRAPVDRAARQPVAQRERDSEEQRSEERRVGKECRSRWSPYH